VLTWRYHLLSLVAVFLALGLGVLVGISLSSNGTIQSGQSVLVNDIQHDIEDLRAENNDLSHDRATNLRYQDDSFPFIVGGRLQGKRIAVVASASAGDEIQRKLTSAIHAGGGQVVSSTVLNPRFDQAAMIAKIRTDMKSDPLFATVDDPSLPAVVAREFAREIGRGGGGGKLIAAMQGILVDSQNGSYDLPVDAVVVIDRADGNQAAAYADLEKNFLLDLKDLGTLTVGTETTDAPQSEIPLFQSVDISSVDNLDSRIGQVSLVYILSGEKGAFGIKPTADLLIPILRGPRASAAVASTTPSPTTTAATP